MPRERIETPEQRERRLIRDRERARLRRLNETENERENRLSRAREYIRNRRRDQGTPIERRRRLHLNQLTSEGSIPSQITNQNDELHPIPPTASDPNMQQDDPLRRNLSRRQNSHR
ncbi:hypothetical protein HMI56_005071, partial [Coelomomyces lativittatus]